MSQTDFEPPEEEINAPIPQPILWRIVIRPLESQKKVGDIVMTEKTQEDQQYITVVGQVVAMGEQAYKSPKLQDSNNPTLGSWVLYPTNAGQRIELQDGRNFILCNDDAVMAVVDDPEPYRKKLV